MGWKAYYMAAVHHPFKPRNGHPRHKVITMEFNKFSNIKGKQFSLPLYNREYSETAEHFNKIFPKNNTASILLPK